MRNGTYLRSAKGNHTPHIYFSLSKSLPALLLGLSIFQDGLYQEEPLEIKDSPRPTCDKLVSLLCFFQWLL